MIVAADVVLAVIMTVQKKRTALSNSLPSTFASAGNPATAEFLICLKKVQNGGDTGGGASYSTSEHFLMTIYRLRGVQMAKWHKLFSLKPCVNFSTLNSLPLFLCTDTVCCSLSF